MVRAMLRLTAVQALLNGLERLAKIEAIQKRLSVSLGAQPSSGRNSAALDAEDMTAAHTEQRS